MTLSIMDLFVLIIIKPLSITTIGICINCHYAECLYAECRYAECRYAECRYAECRYAECRYAVCRYFECRYFVAPPEAGTVKSFTVVIIQYRGKLVWFVAFSHFQPGLIFAGKTQDPML
jgi:hypothetical protein